MVNDNFYIQSQLLGFCSHHQVECLDFNPGFKEEKKKYFMLHDSHFNELGSEFVASKLVKKVIAMNPFKEN